MTEVPEQMKRDTWSFYVFARSNDPSVAIPYTRKLVGNLVNEVKIAETKEHAVALEKALTLVSDAWYNFAQENNWGLATHLCEGAMDEITYMIYDKDKRWAIPIQDSFKHGAVSMAAPQATPQGGR